MKKLLLLLLIFTHVFAFAQNEHIKYDENGNLLEQGQFDEKGKATGEWKWYHNNGQLQQIGNFENSQRKGIWIFYSELGIIKEEGEFDKNGNKTGKWKYYNQNGKLIETKNETL